MGNGGGSRPGSGRKGPKFLQTQASPIVEINLKQVEELAKLDPTATEFAAILGIGRDTFFQYMKRQEFRDAVERGRSAGCMSLRRCQMKLATEKLHPAMLIFLGKNRLGQSDNGPNQPEDAGVTKVIFEWQSTDSQSDTTHSQASEEHTQVGQSSKASQVQ